MKTLMSALVLTLLVTAPSHEGQIDAAATSVDGTWSQGGNNLPLVWKRSSR